MTKGQRGGMGQLQLKLKKINPIIGVHAEKVQSNRSAIHLTKVQNLGH